MPPMEKSDASNGDLEFVEPKEKTLIYDEDKIVFKRTHLYAVLLPLAFVLGLSVGYLFWGRDLGTTRDSSAQTKVDIPTATQSSNTGQSQEPQAVKRFDVQEDDDPVIGSDEAVITLIEFSDYECPYCGRWHDQVFKQIIQDFPAQVRIVYRDFPLTSIHPNAVSAAIAANCARDQEVFWDFHEKLFSNEYDLGEAAYLQYAKDLDLDVEEFTMCLESEQYKQEVMDDFQYAAGLGVSSTPTFFLNGIPIVGAQPYEVFKQIIEKELAGEIP